MNRLIPTKLIPIGAALLLVLVATSALASTKTERRMENALEVMQEFTGIPEQGIPSRILKNAYGVAVIPGVIKVGLTIGGRYGKGILVVRQDDGQWSNPSFISLGGASIGFQIGAQSTDLVLVFKDRRSIDKIVNGKLTLGADASAAAGPVGRQTSAATDQRLAAEIYSYSRNRGLFAGVSLEGAWLGMDRGSNQEFYGNGMSPKQIMDANNMPAPIAATQFLEVLTAATPKQNRSGSNRVAQASRTAPASSRQPVNSAPANQNSAPTEVRTYAIDPVTGGGDETSF
jgi:lipid-binding SYLF domain-containing protein